jgi:hypothetical protein
MKDIAVFTEWPQLITDSSHSWRVNIRDSCAELVSQTFGTYQDPNNLLKYVARTHDRKLHDQFQYCLFVNQPCAIDLADYILLLQNKFTTLIDPTRNVVLYRRDDMWLDHTVDFINQSDLFGIIFIDCWQDLVDAQTWSDIPQPFDFITHIKQQLQQYRCRSLIFHTNNYGNLPLAQGLIPWSKFGHAREVDTIAQFESHYRSLELFNWIVVGAHWQRCTHDRPLGFKQLVKTKQQDPKLHIYSHSQCTVKFLNDDLANPVVSLCTHKDYETDLLCWQSQGKLYELSLQ